MPTDPTTFPTLLSRDDAKAAANAEHWQHVAAALHLIAQAGYTDVERLFDHDVNARACRAALVDALSGNNARSLRDKLAAAQRDHTPDQVEAGRVLDIAIKGLVKARTDVNAQRRIANLLEHGSLTGPGSS